MDFVSNLGCWLTSQIRGFPESDSGKLFKKETAGHCWSAGSWLRTTSNELKMHRGTWDMIVEHFRTNFLFNVFTEDVDLLPTKSITSYPFLLLFLFSHISASFQSQPVFSTKNLTYHHNPVKLDFLSGLARLWAQVASALPPQGGELKKSCQNNALTAFLNCANISLSRNSTFSTNRRVSTTRICERIALAVLPWIFPTETRSGCRRDDVVNGITIQVLAPNPRMITTGRRNNFSLPSCSEPTLTPSRHHQISRTVYKRGCSSFVLFFSTFQLSKSFCILIE